MSPHAIIFDRDGVLTYFDVELATSFFTPLLPFSIYELAKQWQAWGAKIGFPTTGEEENAFFAGFWRELAQTYTLDTEQYHTLAACRYTDFIKVYPEVKDVLRELKQRSVAVGVLSNFSLATLDASLEAVGVRQWIDAACAATVIGYAKPQPEAYRHVAALLDVAPEACFFFDDEMPCVEGARAVGMTAFFVDRQLAQDERAKGIVHNLVAALEIVA